MTSAHQGLHLTFLVTGKQVYLINSLVCQLFHWSILWVRIPLSKTLNHCFLLRSSTSKTKTSFVVFSPWGSLASAVYFSESPWLRNQNKLNERKNAAHNYHCFLSTRSRNITMTGGSANWYEKGQMLALFQALRSLRI